MNQNPDLALARRLDAALAPLGPPDWADVLRRGERRSKSERGARSRRSARLALSGAALALALAALPPFGLAARVYHSVAGDSPPIVRVTKELGKLAVGSREPIDGGVPRLQRPQIVPGTTRLVATLAVPGGATARLWAARTRGGGFCFVSAGRPFGRGGCSLQMTTEPVWARFGEWVARPGRYQYSVVGRVQVPGVRAVAIHYRDGAVQRAVVTGAWFMAVIPESHGFAMHLPRSIAALDASGRELAASMVAPVFRSHSSSGPAAVRPKPAAPTSSSPRTPLADARPWWDERTSNP